MSSNLVKRVSSAIPLIIAGFLFIYFSSRLVFYLISGAILAICLWEYVSAIKKIHNINNLGLYLSSGIFYIGLLLLWNKIHPVAEICLVVSLIVAVIMAVSKKDKKLDSLGWYFLPVIWLCVPIFLLSVIRFNDETHLGSFLIFFIIIVAAVNDICAYFGGTKFGKHKLAPRISPNKSIEGSIFGFLGGTIAAYLYLAFLVPSMLTTKLVFVLIVLMIAASQLGDLFESAIKRHVGVKDSSNIIPGHGGVLDRFDAYLFAIPTFLGLRYIFL